MSVEIAVEGTAIQARHFHVIPRNKSMTVADGVSQIRPRKSEDCQGCKIFFSIARYMCHRAVAVLVRCQL